MAADPMLFSRREFGKLTLAGLPLSLAGRGLLADIDSKIKNVQIGAISYSFRTMPDPNDIIKAFVTIGLGEIELMSNHAEALAGAPPAPAGRGGGAGRGRGEMTDEQRAAAQAAQQARAEEMRKWRLSTSPETYKAVRKKIEDAGIDLRILCFNMNRNTTDDEIEYAFQMAKTLGVKALSSSTQVSVAKRVAPFADKHKMIVAYHGHDNVKDPEEFATPESFAAAMSFSKYHYVNLDIGHFTAANYDPIEYIEKHAKRISHLHLKDRKRDHGPNVPWGQGDTPIKPVLQLLSKKKYDIPANIEFEYQGEDVVEVAKCLQFCKDALA
jgi:sugar phosphate isomerase/epimerase